MDNFELKVETPKNIKDAKGQQKLQSIALSGTITNIKCEVGDKIRSGQVILVLEAMKMETEIVAEENLEILQIPVAVGDKVAQGQALIKFRKRKLIMDLIQELWLGSGLAKTHTSSFRDAFSFMFTNIPSNS